LGDLAPETDVSLLGLRNLRFNRVEGLSLGATAGLTYGPLRADATARLGLADLEPNVELGVARQTMFWRTRLAGYRRLTPFDRESRALGFGASVAALLLGRDEADYFRATGAELTGDPLRASRWTYTWRLFGEHQHGVSKNTDLSLARVWEGSNVFRENRPADRADQAGAGLTLRREFGSDRSPVQLLTGVGAEGQAGTYEYGRGSVFARMTAPFTSRLAFALEGAAGTTTGDVPIQGQWYVGGTQSARGYEGALLGGTAFWRARAELATPTPAARLVVFGDAAWAGPRGAWSRDPRLLSAGVGASFLDGLIRMDLSRALRTPTGWRLDLYLDAAL
ncbi:MAG TPA: BamA/TamA family outer membrane protein, partial [Longimicrobium sp.]|nr:BamA/TamA family outer membrane protein [Longimicrobium sp.]